jgi:hypothetical protein
VSPFSSRFRAPEASPEEAEPGGAGGERRAGEGARVAEAVEHPSAAGVDRHACAVVALVEIEARLVTAAQRDGEPRRPLGDDHLVGSGRPDPAALGLEALDARRGRIVEPVHRRPGKEIAEGIGDPLDRPRHAEGQALQHADGPVTVHHEPGQPIGLAPAEAKGDRRRGPR